MALFDELKRRSVFRVALGYLVVGWLLTEVLTTILPTLGAPGWAARAVILIFAFGFVPAIVLSWFYELTPEGIKRDDEVREDSSAAAKTENPLQWVTIAGATILVLILGFLGAQQDVDDPAPTTVAVNQASVAVLPFVNMSSDQNNQYFSDGLTETLLHMLAQHPELKVAARTSSFAVRDQGRTIIEIARLLGVAHVLEGSVQRDGDRVRVTAQLIRADDGFHVWSETYDLTFDDIFGIQDQIAAKVGSALTTSLLGRSADVQLAGVATDSSDAYDLYLMAINERSTFSYGGLRAAEDLLKGALTIDPGFVEAKTELASVYIHEVETGLRDQVAARTEVIAITSQVLAVKPDDIDALAMRAYVEVAYLIEQAEPEVLFGLVDQLEDIIKNNPHNYQPRLLLTRILMGLRLFERAIEVQQKALVLDPFNPRILYELGALYAAHGEANEARDTLQQSLQIQPNQPNAYVTLGVLALQTGDGVDFVQQILQAIQADPKDHEIPGMVAAFLYNLKLIEEGDDFRDRVLAIAPTSEVAYQTALTRAINTGDTEAGLAIARKAIEDDIDNRRFAYGSAVQYLLRHAARNGTVDQELAYLEERVPGIFDVSATSPPEKYRAAQFVAFDAWYTTLPTTELLGRLAQFREVATSYGFDPKDNPGIEFAVLALQGNVEGAIDIGLKEFASKSPLHYPGWRDTLAQAQYVEIARDPRMRKLMSSWSDEEARVREEVRTYLADVQAST
jgi:TolB-like protein/Tfp pilus assembly protein PilF